MKLYDYLEKKYLDGFYEEQGDISLERFMEIWLVENYVFNGTYEEFILGELVSTHTRYFHIDTGNRNIEFFIS